MINKIREELLKQMRDPGERVTFSIGMVTYDQPPDDTRMVVKTSDDLMYSVKKKGKNSLAHLVWDRKEFRPEPV